MARTAAIAARWSGSQVRELKMKGTQLLRRLLHLSSLSTRFSLDGVLTSSPCELTDIAIDLGILKTRFGTQCQCGKEAWKLEERSHYCNWRCTKCRKTISVTAGDNDLFSLRIDLRSSLGALWVFCTPLHLSPDKTGLILGLDHRSTRTLFDKFRKFLTPVVERLNETLHLGGFGSDVELDEISFRSKTVGERVIWIRYLAIARRGSPKIWISPLPYRITEGGQGGGGRISVEELQGAMWAQNGESRICEGSVCHSDGARTYKQLGVMESPLLDTSVFHHVFGSLKLAHTAVKHKPPKPEFAETFNVKVWNGRGWVMEQRQGGTQKLDGFSASFRREVGRKPFSTAGPSLTRPENLEQHLHERMRCFQLSYWLSGSDLFQVFGALRKAELEGGASWQTSAPFLQDQNRQDAVESIDSGSDDARPLFLS
ncbi:unnamed protein product [Symbiodinium sp. CCMP2456]|nr:unnamed protein product [Symbiodinium sp. CCMP2456]